MITSTTTIQIGNVTLNQVDSNGVEWKVDSDGFDGWGTPSSTLTPVQKPRQDGMWGGYAFNTGRSLAVRGRVLAPTSELLTSSLDALYAAVSLDDTLFTVSEAGKVRHCVVRRTTAVTSKRLNNRTATFAFQVIAVDPRKLGDELSGVTFLPMTTGGLTVPFTVPFTISSTVISGQISLTNPGNASGPVRMRVDGPGPGPVITHVGTGSSLVFASSLVLGSGEWIDIDMDAHSVLANGQASRNGWVTSRGWSSFEPGSNTWSFTSAGYNAAMKLTVYATPADD